MRLISHRGNIIGPNPEEENTIPYICRALACGYNVEIDVWEINGELFLGHDEPKVPAALDFLQESRLWCHAKNEQALFFLLQNKIHCFWHENDKYTLTSHGIAWVYPGQQLLPNSVAVKPEGHYTSKQLSHCYGVCSDYIALFKI